MAADRGDHVVLRLTASERTRMHQLMKLPQSVLLPLRWFYRALLRRYAGRIYVVPEPAHPASAGVWPSSATVQAS